jgi:glycosyltransferase involved in cell wall biosynthesis
MGYVFSSDDIKARVLRPIVRSLLRLTLQGEHARLILQNVDDMTWFESQRITPSRVYVIRGSGVNCERFRPTDGFRRKDGVTCVLMAARLLRDKGVEEFAEAAARLHRTGRRVRFLLAGIPDDGNPASIPEAKLKAWHDEGVLEWLGHVDEMPQLLATVDVVALPSYREGLPKSLIEAAACGVALVTTDVPGCREVVLHEEDGLLVPVRDATALASAIARLHDNPDYARALGIRARAKAMTEFSETVVLKQTLSVYKALTPPTS